MKRTKVICDIRSNIIFLNSKFAFCTITKLKSKILQYIMMKTNHLYKQKLYVYNNVRSYQLNWSGKYVINSNKCKLVFNCLLLKKVDWYF